MPGTGKTLLARALANNIKASYLKVVASAIVDKYIGECFAPGTRLMLWNGRSKAVEDVVAGDQLMGDDGQPRVVQPRTLVSGRGPMYKVTSANAGRMTWSCTLNHILVLTINARPFATALRDAFVVMYWDLEPARAGPIPTSRPVRRTVTTSNKTRNGREEALKFPTREQAEGWIDTCCDDWRPPVFECTVGEYLQFTTPMKSVSAMFSPIGGVDFMPPVTSLRARLEDIYGHAVSDAQVLDTAWVLGVWLADGDKSGARVFQIGINASQPQHSHVPVIQHLVRWRLSMDGGVTDLAPTTVDKAVFEGFTPHERVVAESLVRFTHFTSAGNRMYNVRLGPKLFALLRSYKLVDNKHFPHELLCESKAVRRALLEGVIDGDGHLSLAAGGMYELPAKCRVFLDGAIHLSRGLGFSAGKVTRREKPSEKCDTGEVYTGYRVFIGGLHAVETPLLPRLSYKRVGFSTATYNKSALCDTVTISSAGDGDWYGFQVDGNRRFLLDDFVVTHNSARIIREMFGYAKEHQPCGQPCSHHHTHSSRMCATCLSHPRLVLLLSVVLPSDLHGRGGRHRWPPLLAGHVRRPRDPAHADGAAQPAGRLRRPRTRQDGHGHQPTRHTRPRTAPAWTTRPQDRDPHPQREQPPRHPQDTRTERQQARRHRLRRSGQAVRRIQRGGPEERGT